MTIVSYDRVQAVAYAKRWAYDRNRRYIDFHSMGGDCTSFASQCLLAGGGVMNFTPVHGWYYRSASDRTPSWSGVRFLHDFLIGNRAIGPFARPVMPGELEVGDLIQLGNSARFYHTLVLVHRAEGRLFIATHSDDAWMRPLDDYSFERARFLHIEGIRKKP